MSPTRRKNLKIIVPCIAVIGIMLGLVAYSPTLYRLFCAATGYGAQRNGRPPARMRDRSG